jgi:AmmeMemoRadiSam system protein A
MLPPEERKRLLAIARRAVRDYVLQQALPETLSATQPPTEASGVFVTLHVAGRLRGCLGRLHSDEPVDALVATCAVLAASRDPRFTPLRAPELDPLDIEISLLSAPEQISAVNALEEIRPGIHGLIVTQGDARGLLLPQVATGWGARRFLEETCRKAALPPEAWRESTTRIDRFTAEVFSDSGERAARPCVYTGIRAGL